MVSVKRPNLWYDESGAAYLEFTAAAFTFFIILFGVLEFAQVFYQWNAATKATQFGSRLAAVSSPVASNLASLTGTEAGALPGAAMPGYDCTCKFSSGAFSCTGSVPSNATACTFDATAMNVLAYGRKVANNGTVTVNTSCQTMPPAFQNAGMCNFFSGLTANNIVVRYQNTGLGYAGRPPGVNQTGAPVPTISVSLTGLTYKFILIGGLAGLNSMPLPGFATTVTGEDLNASGS